MLRILLIAFSLFSFTVNAQNAVLAKVVDGKAFIGHTVAGGETLYGIARSYGISPKDLASFNGLNLQKGLEKNTVLKIPITTTTIFAKPCTKCNTIKYAVQPHEGLYRIGVNFGNIGTQNLTKLNSLTSDNLATGQELIVGYMKSTGNEISMVDNSQPIETVQNNVDVTSTAKETPAKPNAAIIKEKDNPAKETIASGKQEPITTKPINPPVEKVQEPVATVKKETIVSATSAEGAFGPQFNNKYTQDKSGTAGIFKSISGWQDKKYYALMNSVEAGTILRIDNMTNGKAIYAKVLGPMPNVKGSDALLLRISDAGVAALEGEGETMQVTVNY